MFIKRIGAIAAAAVACVIVMIGLGWAAQSTDLSARELKTRMDSGETIFVMNPLSDIEFNEGHIPGSVNIPIHTIANTDQLPADKSTPIVTYCLGPKWVMYKQAAGQVAARGYTNVTTFKGGIPAWMAAGYSLDKSGSAAKTQIPSIGADRLKAMLGNVTIVDIRPAKLYEIGWISGSIKIPMEMLSAEYGSITKEKPIVVVDHLGKRVLAAGRFLMSKRYDNVQRLQGGLMTWSRKGYPLER